MDDVATLRFLSDALQCQGEAGIRWLEADALVELCLLALVGPPLDLSAVAYARAIAGVLDPLLATYAALGYATARRSRDADRPLYSVAGLRHAIGHRLQRPAA